MLTACQTQEHVAQLGGRSQARPALPFLGLATPVLPRVLLGRGLWHPPPRTPVSTASGPMSQEHRCRAPLVLWGLSGPTLPTSSAGNQPHTQLALEPRDPQGVTATKPPSTERGGARGASACPSHQLGPEPACQPALKPLLVGSVSNCPPHTPISCPPHPTASWWQKAIQN